MGQLPGQMPAQPPGGPVAAGPGGGKGLLAGGLPGLMKKPAKPQPLTAQGALGQQPAQSMWQRLMPTIGALRDRGALQAAAAAQPMMPAGDPQQPGDDTKPF
jgi:hypothetical protein